MANCNKASVPKFFETIDIVDEIVHEKKWELEKKMNKYYVSYKYGFPIVFGVTWIGSKSFGLFFNLTREKAKSIIIPDIAAHRYEDEWKQVLYKVEKSDRDMRKLMPLFDAAFKHITGIKQ